MIKIIKEGSPRNLHSIKRFHCYKCGCIFEADDESYSAHLDRNEIYINANCPYCNETINRNSEDFEA